MGATLTARVGGPVGCYQHNNRPTGGRNRQKPAENGPRGRGEQQKPARGALRAGMRAGDALPMAVVP